MCFSFFSQLTHLVFYGLFCTAPYSILLQTAEEEAVQRHGQSIQQQLHGVCLLLPQRFFYNDAGQRWLARTHTLQHVLTCGHQTWSRLPWAFGYLLLHPSPATSSISVCQHLMFNICLFKHPLLSDITSFDFSVFFSSNPPSFGSFHLSPTSFIHRIYFSSNNFTVYLFFIHLLTYSLTCLFNVANSFTYQSSSSLTSQLLSNIAMFFYPFARTTKMWYTYWIYGENKNHRVVFSGLRERDGACCRPTRSLSGEQ